MRDSRADRVELVADNLPAGKRLFGLAGVHEGKPEDLAVFAKLCLGCPRDIELCKVGDVGLRPVGRDPEAIWGKGWRDLWCVVADEEAFNGKGG